MKWGAKAAVRKGLCIAFSVSGVTVVLGNTFCLLLQIHLHPACALRFWTVWTPSVDVLLWALAWVWPIRRPWWDIGGKWDDEFGLFIPLVVSL